MKTLTQNFWITLATLSWSASVLVAPSTGLAQTTNQVLTLDGSGDYVSVPSAADLQNPSEITVECWLFPTKTAGIQYASLINKGDGQTGDTERTYELRWLPDGSVTFAVFFALPVTANQPEYAQISTTIASNMWTHIAGTYNTNNSGLRLYTNGVLAASATTFATHPFLGLTLRQTTLPVVFGFTPPYVDSYASGGMDEVRIWTTARNQSDIASSRSCRLTGSEPNLAGYWNFDAGTAVDLTGHGHNGTLSGNAAIVPMIGEDVIHAGCGLVLDIRVSQVELCWYTMMTNWYQLQYKSSLTTNVWVPFMTNWIAGDGNRFCTNDAVLPDQVQRFYRVVVTNSLPQ
jgi:hypothetical protein